MERCSSREPELSRLLAKFGPRLRDRIGIPADLRGQLSAQDVMQEAYLGAFVAIEHMPRDEVEVLPWLRTITRNTLIDAIRTLRAEKRGGGRPRLDARSRGESIFGQRLETPSREVRGHERAQRLHTAAESLPEPYRRAARAMLTGESPSELAGALGKSIGATHMLLTRTRGLLQKALGGGPSDYLDSR